MKQIVPFVKEIELKNNIEEITSISLDHTLKRNGLNEINGEFSLYFEYKENEISVNTESYSCKIPFNIDLDDRYILKDSNIDIDDFYYEIEDRKVILHIDVLVDNIDIKESEIEIMPRNIDKKVSEEFNDERTIEEEKGDEDIKIDDLFKEIDTDVDLDVPKKDEEESKKTIEIFETFDSKSETYVTYNVHIVRENDTIDSICSKYGVTKEELSNYNELKDIKFGDKLIVPTYKK